MALPLPGVTIEDCMSYSVFAIGSAADPAVGGNALQVAVAVDATASKTLPTTDTVGAAEGTAPAGIGLMGMLIVAVAASVGFAATYTLLTRRVRND